MCMFDHNMFKNALQPLSSPDSQTATLVAEWDFAASEKIYIKATPTLNMQLGVQRIIPTLQEYLGIFSKKKHV